ncbi:hypothetical protein [Gynuella sunshinyii]|uniref:Uncharacterized protein n=1 Tax=Gynuella sunshinyii YC6258 TaxID=1445510 RepID=A0A0C5VCG5_9GAMM|nr:hypothetical protein [Gynuella sunshinyii]AJQ97030.1 hypothetical Protein YC6258_04998 [Gynuella sunshinyii YC6258]
MSSIQLSEAQTKELLCHRCLSVRDEHGQIHHLPDFRAFGLAHTRRDACSQVSAILTFMQAQFGLYDHPSFNGMDEEALIGQTLILSLCRSLLALPES